MGDARTHGRTHKSDSISPFGIQSGTKKAGKITRSNKPPGKSYVEHFYGHFKEKKIENFLTGYVILALFCPFWPSLAFFTDKPVILSYVEHFYRHSKEKFQKFLERFWLKCQ